MKITNVLILLVILGLSSCKKNHNETEKSSSDCKITSINEERGSVSTYTYDADGRISHVTGLLGYGDGFFTYKYQSGIITFTSTINASDWTIFVDASGRIKRYGIDTYNYNSDGYLIEKLSSTQIKPKLTLSYANGNLVRAVLDGEKEAEITYYDEPVQNLLGYESAIYSSLITDGSGSRSGFSTIDAKFIGKGSRNLVKSITLKYMDGNPIKWKETMAYTKDRDGKIILETITMEAPAGWYNGTAKVNFTYQCQ